MIMLNAALLLFNNLVDYSVLTKDKNQLQFLLQVVDEHRRAFPGSRNQTLAGHSGQGP